MDSLKKYNPNLGENMIVNMTMEFSLSIIEFSEKLEGLKKYVIARQILRSGTSKGANVWEAQNAESPADFVHKMKIGAKEGDENEYWLTLCCKAPSYSSCPELISSLMSIKKVLSKIISTSKRNQSRSH